MASSHGKAVHHGDDGLGDAAYLTLYVQDAEVRQAVLADVASTPLDVHVTSGTEGIRGHPLLVALTLLAGAVSTGEQHHTQAWRLVADAQGIAHLPRGERGEGIAYMGTVDGDTGYALPFVQEYLTVVLDGFPIAVGMHDS